jgi:1,4-dihydroxy-2-naphthoyl-CoA synthase
MYLANDRVVFSRIEVRDAIAVSTVHGIVAAITAAENQMQVTLLTGLSFGHFLERGSYCYKPILPDLTLDNRR